MRAGLGLLLVGAAVMWPGAAWAADFPPPIDEQVVQDQDTMTWDDYRPVPGKTWNDPSLKPTERELKIAVVAVDFEDQPFVITQPKFSDPFGNPQIDPIDRAAVPQFYASFLGTPSSLNRGHTVREYWMEQTHGRIGMTFTPYGPYRMPRPLYEYGLNEFDQNGVGDEKPTGGGCPSGHSCNGNMDPDVDALWRADAGERIRDQYDLVLRIYAGYDETTVWQEFGEMKFETKEEIPDDWGNPDPLKPNWVTNRYVPWTSWRAGAQQWGLSSIRQGESSGTITHEIVHTFGLPDNNNNPYVQPYHRVGTGPWDILDRGSFNGPGGPHKRWLVPVTQGGAMEAGMTLRTKLSEGWFEEEDVHRVTSGSLAASGVQVMRVQARSVEPAPGTLTGVRLDLDGGDRTPACDVNTQPLCAGPGWQYYTLETVQRLGVDSMTPDSGVLLTKNKERQSNGCGYSCFGWVIDAHPEDINMVDFLRPRTKTPVMRTIGDYRQLNDALFHAGTDSGSQYEFEDAPNRLHFYVLDVHRDATGVQSYDVAIRSLDGAGPHTRGVNVGRPTMALSSEGVSSCTFPVANTGTTAQVAPPGGTLDDPNPYVDNDVYRLQAVGSPGVEVHLTNALAAIKAGASKDIPVYFQGKGSLTLRATSESDPSKSATAVCSAGDGGGTVPPTLSLSLGAPVSFGAFTPGLPKDYTASTTATVISTAGDATLSVSDPSSNAPGHLVNGAFSLPEPLMAKASTATNPGGALSALPANLLTWSAPVSNDAVTIDFAQRVNAGDALRTGTYAKTLTFTLSTTNP